MCLLTICLYSSEFNESKNLTGKIIAGIYSFTDSSDLHNWDIALSRKTFAVCLITIPNVFFIISKQIPFLSSPLVKIFQKHKMQLVKNFCLGKLSCTNGLHIVLIKQAKHGTKYADVFQLMMTACV